MITIPLVKSQTKLKLTKIDHYFPIIIQFNADYLFLLKQFLSYLQLVYFVILLDKTPLKMLYSKKTTINYYLKKMIS